MLSAGRINDNNEDRGVTFERMSLKNIEKEQFEYDATYIVYVQSNSLHLPHIVRMAAQLAPVAAPFSTTAADDYGGGVPCRTHGHYDPHGNHG